MEEIVRFVTLAQSDRYTVTELCEQFGISRKTGYKHLERYAASGLPGLRPRSHRPHRCPQRTASEVEALIVAERHLHRTWGPKKLQEILRCKHGLESPPACSTIAALLQRREAGERGHGLTLDKTRGKTVLESWRGSCGWSMRGRVIT